MKEQLLAEYTALGFTSEQANILVEQFLSDPNYVPYGEGQYTKEHKVSANLKGLTEKNPLDEFIGREY